MRHRVSVVGVDKSKAGWACNVKEPTLGKPVPDVVMDVASVCSLLADPAAQAQVHERVDWLTPYNIHIGVNGVKFRWPFGRACDFSPNLW